MDIFLIASEKLIYLLDINESRGERKGQKYLFQVQVFQICVSECCLYLKPHLLDCQAQPYL